MLKPKYSKKFKKDVKRVEHNKIVMLALREVIEKLLSQQLLNENKCDHALNGNWIGHRECHVKPDVLLIYKVDEDNGILFLERLGTHSDLFK